MRQFLLVSVIIVLAAPVRADEADDLCQRGQALQQQRLYQQAIAAFGEAIRLNPQLDEAFAGRAKAEYAAGQLQPAVQDATEALRLKPTDKAYLVRYVARFDLKQYAGACDDLLAGLKLSPQNPLLWNNLGTLCHEFGRYGQAVQAYDKALALLPNWQVAKENRQNSIQAHADVLNGKLRPPAGDLKKLAAFGPKRGEPLNFWLSHGRKDVLTMTKEEVVGNYKETTTIEMKTIRVEIPRRGLNIVVHFPLQKGEILRPTIRIAAPPGLVILGESKDPFGVIEGYVKLYLDWLYFKSGLP